MRNAKASAKQQLVDISVALTTNTKAFIDTGLKAIFIDPVQGVVEAFQPAVTETGGGGGQLPPPILVEAVPTPPSLPTSNGVAFAKPLAVVAENQSEKAGWFAGFIDQNKAWLPWAVGGTVGLGLLATIGVWASKKRNPQNQHLENQAPQHS